MGTGPEVLSAFFAGAMLGMCAALVTGLVDGSIEMGRRMEARRRRHRK